MVIEEEIPAGFASEAVAGTTMRTKRARGTLDLDRKPLPSVAPGPITLQLNSKDVVNVDVQIYLPEQRVMDFICTDPVAIERLLAQSHYDRRTRARPDGRERRLAVCRHR